MKIAIFTYHDINNYGAQLQAASLQKYTETLGHQTEVIDYKPIRTRKRILGGILIPLYKRDFKKFIFEIIKRRVYIYSYKEIIKVSTKKFFTEASVLKDNYNDYEVLICGSDELWNFNNYLGYQRPYILDFDKNKSKKISYAASFGNLQANKELTSKMENSLKRFSKILVRDPSTKKFVEDMGLQAERVLDPTFLFDFDTSPVMHGDYIVLSGALSNSQIEKAIKFARDNNYRVVTPGNMYKGFEKLSIQATAKEWISCIKYAKFHFTTLFHGAIFSMKYQTPFAVFVTESKKQKVSSLLELFGQEERIVGQEIEVDRLTELSKLEFPSDFEAKKNKLIEESKDRLKIALG